VDHEREWPPELALGELRADVRHLMGSVSEIRQDIRRLDDRVFQVVLLQLGTLVSAVGALIAALVAAVLR
jgi:hypothetical protein